jgi:hypothetical protein
MISLGIERLEIDWGKNYSFTDHSNLFRPSDVCDIPYYYADDVIEMKPGLSRKLGAIARRLDLLGYSAARLPARYAELVDAMPDYYNDVPLSFEQFAAIMKAVDLPKAFKTLEAGDYDLGKYVSRYIFEEPEIRKLLPPGITIDQDAGTFFENFDPYLTLRLLAMNPTNSDRLVQWRYADVVEGGWVERGEVVKPLPDTSKILIVTEGSSDSFIIQRTLAGLYPDIADFFHFVDMEEHYPFTGAGNLFRFCQGLASIRIENKVLVVFDNDAAGIEKFDQVRRLKRPSAMHVCRLPDHPDFSSVLTAGPNGLTKADINGAAVAIECFLDLRPMENRPHLIRWTSYNRDLERYQGEIEDKEQLVTLFKKADLTNGSYDSSRLTFLIEHLLKEWVDHAN